MPNPGKPYKANAKVTVLSAKASIPLVNAVKRAAENEGIAPSEWIRDAIETKLASLDIREKAEETKLLVDNLNNIGPNTPVLYKGNKLVLKDLAHALGVSFLYMHRRLMRKETLKEITADLEYK